MEERWRICHSEAVIDTRQHRVGLQITCRMSQWRTQEFFPGGGGVQQIQLRTEDRTGIWGAVAPWSGVLEASVIWYKKFHFIQ